MAVVDDQGKITPQTRGYIYIIIIVIIALILLRNRHRIRKFFEPKAPNLGAEDQLNQPISDSRKTVIHTLANALEKDINNTGWSHDYGLYSQALGLADNELIYLAQYYRTNLSPSESLYDAIGGEYYTWDWVYEEWPFDLQNRLAQLGER